MAKPRKRKTAPTKPADVHARLPPELAAKARSAAARAGRSLTNYVCWLITEDIRRGGVK